MLDEEKLVRCRSKKETCNCGLRWWFTVVYLTLRSPYFYCSLVLGIICCKRLCFDRGRRRRAHKPKQVRNTLPAAVKNQANNIDNATSPLLVTSRVTMQPTATVVDGNWRYTYSQEQQQQKVNDQVEQELPQCSLPPSYQAAAQQAKIDEDPPPPYQKVFLMSAAQQHYHLP